MFTLTDDFIDYVGSEIDTDYLASALADNFIGSNYPIEHKNEDGKLHRDNDLPAVISENGTQMWFQNGKRHRDEDKPAVIYLDGAQLWFANGLAHRCDDKPACEYLKGEKRWFLHGKEHRDNDKPAHIWPNGTQWWYQNNEKHRDGDKPAIIQPDGVLLWYKFGKKLSNLQIFELIKSHIKMRNLRRSYICHSTYFCTSYDAVNDICRY